MTTFRPLRSVGLAGARALIWVFLTVSFAGLSVGSSSPRFALISAMYGRQRRREIHP
jgi:hypothetical protein